MDSDEHELVAIKNVFSQQADIAVIGSSTNSKTAIDEILALKPCLVISDLYMTQMGGIGLMNALRVAGSDCGFVILSHSWSSEVMRDFFSSGGLDFLLKPLDLQGIDEVLERLDHKLRKDTKCFATQKLQDTRRHIHG